jgi:hypothetical protein
MGGNDAEEAAIAVLEELIDNPINDIGRELAMLRAHDPEVWGTLVGRLTTIIAIKTSARQLSAVVTAFLREMDGSAWPASLLPGDQLPSEVWPYSLLVAGLRALGTEYTPGNPLTGRPLDPLKGMPMERLLERLPLFASVVHGGERLKGADDATLQGWSWGIEDTLESVRQLIADWKAANQ